MLILTGVLFLLSALFMLYSLYAQKQEAGVGKQREEDALQLMGDVYELQSQVKRLEDEILTTPEGNQKKTSSLQQLTVTANLKYEQGFSIEQIATSLQLHEDEVIHLLPDHVKERYA
ncbi:hypothetical protein [Geomicrobium sp. JCM 19039]|uniref:hypothetical protein n=2 Tax=unclassified Geomicrobium TaxID=2628951 RepID=UPI00045F3094|nr:hypothetical protein [Geomicrobium sp. JCM 19039]GAK14658.1 hypothetical protein JCM19039_4597 [Geomicrobium sp. JCM 19039]